VPPHLQQDAAVPTPYPEGEPGSSGDVVVEDDEAPQPANLLGACLTAFILGLLFFLVLGSIFLIAVLIRTGKVRGPADEVADESSATASRIRWTDASTNSLNLNRVQVRVRRAEWDVVRGRDASRKIVVSAAKYLSIYVNIKNHRMDRVAYKSRFSRPNKASLSDNRHRFYQEFRGSRFNAIELHVEDADLVPREDIDDRLIFIVPDTVDRDSIECFHLELPARAVGSDGTFYFEIPRDMVEGF